LTPRESTGPPSAPVAFERNVGQAPERVRFVGRRTGSTVLLTPTQVIVAAKRTRRTTAHADQLVVAMTMIGANSSCELVPEGEARGTSNYLIGSDPHRWRIGISASSAVRYREIYPGVDLVLYASDKTLEYDFVLAPSADPRTISLAFEGAEPVIGPAGDLMLRSAAGSMSHSAPAIYQMVDGRRRIVPGKFARTDCGTVTFALGAYDRTAPVVIDPAVDLSTYFGGSSFDFPAEVAVDAQGGIYFVGTTFSFDYPLLNSGGRVRSGENDAFVTKLSSDGSVAYSTVIGGSGQEDALGVAVDPSGQAIISGRADSEDFPTTPGAFQTAPRGPDGFVAKLSGDGSGLVFSTRVGGGDEDFLTGVDIDDAGDIYTTGLTRSDDFPATAGAAQQQLAGNLDVVVVKLSSTGSTVSYATYLGGPESDLGPGEVSISVDQQRNAIVAGTTSSPGFPTTDGAIQRGIARPFDVFVTKVSASGDAFVYSTLLGGSGWDVCQDVDLTPTGEACIVGLTESTNFPTANALQPSNAGGIDVFVAKLSADGRSLRFATYLGGSGDDGVFREDNYNFAIRLDAVGQIFVAGGTQSTNFPTKDPIQPVLDGEADAFLTKLAADGSAILFSTYLGGSSDELAFGLDVDGAGNACVLGVTLSTDLPLVRPVQSTLAGEFDQFVIRVVDTYTIRWDPPNAENAPPRNAEAVLEEPPSRVRTPISAAIPAVAAGVRALTGYKVYRSTTPNVAITPANLFTTVPPTQTSAPMAPGGSFFAVTACYSNGSESDPSNEAGAGAGAGPSIARVKLKASKVVITGMNFTSTALVFLDGIPFVKTARSKKNGTKLAQKGQLLTGQTVGEYLASTAGPVLVGVRNSNGVFTAFPVPR
jgi:hypothetical protein